MYSKMPQKQLYLGDDQSGKDMMEALCRLI